jgi:hypothetical protein
MATRKKLAKNERDRIIQEHIRLVIERYGGMDAMEAAFERQRAEFDKHWNQDAPLIGRVLRAHLVAEHFVTRYIEFMNPQLRGLDDARLTYAQKVHLFAKLSPISEGLCGGLIHLNRVRNRLGHNLGGPITNEDRSAFLSSKMFAAMRTARQERWGPEPDEPVDVLEEFTRFAVGLLQGAMSPERDHWKHDEATLELLAEDDDSDLT